MKSIIMLLIASVLLIGCTTVESDTTTPEAQVDAELLAEFNQHVTLFDADVADGAAILAVLDESDEQSVTDYLDHATIQINHLNAFYTFFIENQDALKDSGVDTFTWNNIIMDTSEALKSKTASLGYPIE